MPVLTPPGSKLLKEIKLLKTSTLNAIEKDKKDRDEIKTIYKFINNFRYRGKEYMVYIVVREGQNGLIYYDHGIIKEKTLTSNRYHFENKIATGIYTC